MSRWDHSDLASVLAANPALRINRDLSPSTLQSRKVANYPAIPPSGQNKPIKRLNGIGSTERPRRKYRNEPVEVDGRKFASKKEARRYQDLLLLQRAGEIRDLVCQWRYPLEVYGVHVGFYVADFVYMERDGTSVVEDTKGMRTPLYKLKKKLMFAIYGIKIRES